MLFVKNENDYVTLSGSIINLLDKDINVGHIHTKSQGDKKIPYIVNPNDRHSRFIPTRPIPDLKHDATAAFRLGGFASPEDWPTVVITSDSNDPESSYSDELGFIGYLNSIFGIFKPTSIATVAELKISYNYERYQKQIPTPPKDRSVLYNPQFYIVSPEIVREFQDDRYYVDPSCFLVPFKIVDHATSPNDNTETDKVEETIFAGFIPAEYLLTKYRNPPKDTTDNNPPPVT